MTFTSVLLAGGQNKRMNGIAKWELKIGNETMIERSMHKLSLISDEILIVSGAEYKFPSLEFDNNINLVYDHTPFLGPLNGLKTALINSSNRFNFLVASDMPFFSTDLACYMYDLALTKQANVVLPRWNDKLQPLHGIYSKDLVQSITNCLNKEKYSLIKWILAQDKVYIVEEEELTSFTDNGRVFFNMNNPKEYEQAMYWIKEEKRK